MIDIEGKIGDGENLYTITIDRHNEADREARYRLVVSNNILFDDKNVFSVNEKGLLAESLTANSESKVGAVLENLTDTAINIGKIMLKRPGPPLAGFGLPGQPSVALKPFKVSFDPFCTSDIHEAIRQMKAAGFQLSLEDTCEPKPSGKSLEYIARTINKPNDSETSKRGFYYRPLTTVKVRIVCDGDAAIAVNKNVSLPDPSALAVYSVSRGAFAKRDHAIAIVDGEPRKVEHNYPSEAVAATSIPVNITSKLLTALNEAPGLANFIWKPRPAAPEPNADIKAKEARLKAEEDRLKAEENYLIQKKKTADLRKQVGAIRDGVVAPPTGFFVDDQGAVDKTEVAKLKADKLKAENDLEAYKKQHPNAQENPPPLPPVPPQPNVPPDKEGKQ